MTIFANCVALAVYTPYPFGDSNLTNQYLVSIERIYGSTARLAPLFAIIFRISNDVSRIQSLNKNRIIYFLLTFSQTPERKQKSDNASIYYVRHRNARARAPIRLYLD